MSTRRAKEGCKAVNVAGSSRFDICQLATRHSKTGAFPAVSSRTMWDVSVALAVTSALSRAEPPVRVSWHTGGRMGLAHSREPAVTVRAPAAAVMSRGGTRGSALLNFRFVLVFCLEYLEEKVVLSTRVSCQP